MENKVHKNKRKKPSMHQGSNPGMPAYQPLHTTKPPEPADRITPLIILYSDSLCEDWRNIM